MSESPIAVTRLDDGEIWRVTFGSGRGNILDAAALDALSDVFAMARTAAHLKAICLEGAGKHFSFGASVAEHLPDAVNDMLRRFHRLVLGILDSDIIVLGVVRGQCLGGGLEIVSLCHRVFASRDARLGQPEIVLGVFAPVASVVLPERIGRARAEDLCLSGRSVGADEALAMGLVDQIGAADPLDDALAYARTHLLPRSASSLRIAVRAVRRPLRIRVQTELPDVERLYLDELMPTADAVEGLRAFLDKRTPTWRDA
jgi:cyclohexa-1,5-dienecarbonyl-CoA hydratase